MFVCMLIELHFRQHLPELDIICLAPKSFCLAPTALICFSAPHSVRPLLVCLFPFIFYLSFFSFLFPLFSSVVCLLCLSLCL